MNHLAIATLELCVDEDNYEKALQTFKEYANLERFHQRVQSMETLQKSRWVKQAPRATIYGTMPTYESVVSKERGRTEYNLS